MTAPRGIDHLVLAVQSLDEAARRFEALGFTLTPRAAHRDDMGTSNHLAQLAGKNFIELLEVDRPDTIAEHALDADPPRFSFGAHNRAFVRERSGVSALVLQSNDSRADIHGFEKAGLRTYAPLDFERRATLPDGSEATVAFSLAFVTDPGMPTLAFFTCHNRFPEHFWKPAFQRHANGAQSITAVYVAARDPAAHTGFFAELIGGPVSAVEGGARIEGVPGQSLLVLTPERIEAIAPGTAASPGSGALVAGIALSTHGGERATVPAHEACGIFIEWQATGSTGG